MKRDGTNNSLRFFDRRKDGMIELRGKNSFNLGLDCTMNKCFLIMLPIYVVRILLPIYIYIYSCFFFLKEEVSVTDFSLLEGLVHPRSKQHHRGDSLELLRAVARLIHPNRCSQAVAGCIHLF